jgi:iron complex outermembrane receptor protein
MKIKTSTLLLFLFHNLYAQENILQMDLEDLSQIKVSDRSMTLTETDIRNTPSSFTVITQKDIQESGARNLDELLEIYVPDVAYMYKVEGNQLGMGGIISDRNNKILLRLNGQNLNIKASDGGAVTERWFSMLGDIKKITVISGPGSSIYGPGAIAGVINIETFNAESFEGFDTNVKAGAGENFTSVDAKYATHLSNGVGVFLYAGLDNYNGADDLNEAVHKVAFDFTPTVSYLPQIIRANVALDFHTTNINASYQDEIRKKFHLELNYKNFKFWSRYTKSGMAIPTSQQLYTNSNPKYLQDTGTGNEQWSNTLSYKQRVLDQLTLEYDLSYIRSKVVITNSIYPDNQGNRNWVEDNMNLHILSSYTQNNNTSYAVGANYTHNRFGDANSKISNRLPVGTQWSSDMYSLFGEIQYNLTQKLKIFLDLRIDKHTYSNILYSPRIAFIYSINKNNIVKFNYSHSVRVADDADLYYNYEYNHIKTDVEYIDRFELLYTKYKNNFTFNAKSSYNEHNVVSYNDSTIPGITQYIGKVKFYTLEVTLKYTKGAYQFSFSHDYTKQIDFVLSDPNIQRENISASPYGYGNDLANWNNNISKIRLNYKYSNKLKFINSLRIYWGIPGAVDMADYNSDNFSQDGSTYYRLPVYTDGTRAFQESIYFNSGVEYKLNKRTKLSLHGYNLFGLFNEDLNKRNYFKRTSNYIDEAPSISFMLNYKLQ